MISDRYKLEALARWQLVNEFSLLEASLLWCEVLPHNSEDNFEDERGLLPVQRAIAEAINSGMLIATVETRSDGSIDWNETKVSRANLAAWARAHDECPLFLAKELQRLASEESPPEIRSQYRTALLELQEKAIRKFWLSYDGTSPAPTKKEVIAWLCSESRCSREIAESIDKIIRPDNLRRGGRPPKHR